MCVQYEGCSAFKQTAPTATQSTPAPAADPVIYAAGDISCNRAQRAEARRRNDGKLCRSLATYRKMRELERRRGNPGLPNAVLALGDIQYEKGSLGEFSKYYAPDWGPLRPVTFPVLGNHEYLTSGAAGYWQYFDTVGPGSPAPTNRFGARGRGWYAFNVGPWRLYAINSNCANQRGSQMRVSCAVNSD